MPAYWRTDRCDRPQIASNERLAPYPQESTSCCWSHVAGPKLYRGTDPRGMLATLPR